MLNSDDDLFSNKSFGSKNSSSSEILNNSSSSSKTPVKPLKNKNIFDDDLFSGPNVGGVPDVDLFKNSEDIVGKKSSNIENKTDNVIQDEKRKFDIKQEGETTKTEETKNIVNKENDEKKLQYEENLKKDEKIKSISKKSLSFEKNNETENTEKEETDGQILSSGK